MAGGVQIYVGPANQLVLGTVTVGPAAVTLETIDESHQRISFQIPGTTTGEIQQIIADMLAEQELDGGTAEVVGDNVYDGGTP